MEQGLNFSFVWVWLSFREPQLLLFGFVDVVDYLTFFFFFDMQLTYFSISKKTQQPLNLPRCKIIYHRQENMFFFLLDRKKDKRNSNQTTQNSWQWSKCGCWGKLVKRYCRALKALTWLPLNTCLSRRLPKTASFFDSQIIVLVLLWANPKICRMLASQKGENFIHFFLSQY